MPFASASIGKSFRNEISPRSGLLRVREFLMAEVEHYVDPTGGKKHDRFPEISHLELVLLDRDTQKSGRSDVRRMSIGDAVSRRVVDNETLGYFLARTSLFLTRIGADPAKVRFRQHMENEMAHYATDCWDAELLTSYGWIECVGCADRSAYDLTVHARRTGEALVVRENRPEPLRVEEWQVDLEKKKLGPTFKGNVAAVVASVEALVQPQREKAAATLSSGGKLDLDVPNVGPVSLGTDMLAIVKRTRVEHQREYVPNVIEPSFGIGRLIYCVLEHSYWHRPGDTARGVLSLPATISPTKVLIAPLSSNAAFKPLIKRISGVLRAAGVSNTTDASSVSIGRRYARNDELGTPLGVTVDFDSLKDGTVTLRERDGTGQVRGAVEEVVEAIKAVVEGREGWGDVVKRLPAFEGQSGDD